MRASISVCLQHNFFPWSSAWNPGPLEPATAAWLLLMYSLHSLGNNSKHQITCMHHRLASLTINNQAFELIFPGYMEAVRTHNGPWGNICIILCMSYKKHYTEINTGIPWSFQHSCPTITKVSWVVSLQTMLTYHNMLGRTLILLIVAINLTNGTC